MSKTKPAKTKSVRSKKTLTATPEAVNPSRPAGLPPGPSTEQIAILAALIQPKGDFPLTPSSAATLACDLWEACDLELAKRREKAAQTPTEPEPEAELPTPPSDPVPFEKFLQLALPKIRSEDRLPAFKHYLSTCGSEIACLVGDRLYEHHDPSKEEIEAAVQGYREKGIKAKWFPKHCQMLSEAAEALSAKRLTERGRRGAKAKQEKAEADKTPPESA